MASIGGGGRSGQRQRRCLSRADAGVGHHEQRGGGGERVRILVVEDERLMADAIAEGLRRESLAVDVVYDGDAALERLGVNEYDVVVLDRDLPGVHGDDVCKAVLDAGGETRILMLTAAAAVRDRVD